MSLECIEKSQKIAVLLAVSVGVAFYKTLLLSPLKSNMVHYLLLKVALLRIFI